jgi:hypothetical protein
MKFTLASRAVWLPILLVAGLAFVLMPLLYRKSPTGSPSPTPVPRRDQGTTGRLSPPSPPVPPPPAPSISLDPLLRQWRAAILQRNQKGLLDAQSALSAREDEFREALMKLSKEDPDPRVRAFAVTLLGRMKSPPTEEYFVDRLQDAQEYARMSALAVLERAGTAACLAAVDRLASSDPVADVKLAAAQAAKLVRAR